jgi:hypothetical protein
MALSWLAFGTHLSMQPICLKTVIHVCGRRWPLWEAMLRPAIPNGIKPAGLVIYVAVAALIVEDSWQSEENSIFEPQLEGSTFKP